MAVDTRAKRQSAANTVGGGWLTICLPNPTGTVEAGDRAHLAGMYSGIPATPPSPDYPLRQGFDAADFTGLVAMDHSSVRPGRSTTFNAPRGTRR